ncbi:uncharacterized protein LOC119977749 isoform X2 [Scyliorhinus canicula]|uniref:uncharacterized protein LOC119977749 isoform X2 n=1 Tax=Scyliorhinus canicula TaxID=7830 RepID=UPI0018F611EF|nr:uncharacterized protein LOC119977749 isoform X2 [Scyliorhinus canicula]
MLSPILFCEAKREIKKTNQDKLWLKGVTGQWFEEIRKAKFKDQTDVAKILKMPHTLCLRKQNRTALSDRKLPQSKSCPESKNGINHITFSGNSRGDDRLDPFSRPSESSSQSTESHSDQNQCGNYNSLQMESSNVFSQLQVRLKTVTVPQVERKIHVYRDFGKEKHSKVRGQGLETKTIFVDEYEKILGTEDSSNSKLQKTITDEEGVKNDNHQLKQYINDHETNILLNSSGLSENAELQSVSTWCNIENVRNTPLLRNIHTQGNEHVSVETAQYKIDNPALPNSASGPQSSITEPKKIFQNQPINHTDDILTTNTDGCLSNSKCENTRTLLLDLFTKSQSALVVANSNVNSQQSCSSNNICVPSMRDQDHSQSNSDSSLLSSITGSRSLNVGNRDVEQLNLSNSSLNISQKKNDAADDGKSKSIPPISSTVPVHTLFSIYAHKWNTNSQNCDNTAFFQRGGNDFLQTRKHKPISSLSLSEPVCQPRATSFIRVSSKTKHQYSGSDNTNITPQSACNDDHLQSSRGGRECTPLSPGIGKEKPSVDNLVLNKTRMEPLRDAEDPLPESEGNSWKHSCKNEGRCTSLLPTKLICSHLPICVKTCMDNNVLQTCPPNGTSPDLQSGGNNFLEKVKHETSHELSADPKSATKCVRNIIHHNSELLSNQSKTDDVSLVSVSNASLRNGESETINVTEMAITQPPNYKTFASQSLSSTNSALNLDINSKQNYREASGLTISTDCMLSYRFPIRSSYKYLLLDDSVKSIDITADATGNEHKSAPNCVPPLSDMLAEEASPSDIKNILKNASQNWASQTVNSNLPKIHSVNDIQNDKSEKMRTPSSVVAMQWLSTNTNKGNSPKNYQNDGNSNNGQKNISETVNEEQSSATIASQLKQNALLTYTSLEGVNEYLPKYKSATDRKPSQDSLSGQVPLRNFIDSQDKSMTDFPLGDNTTIKNAENYQSEKNIPISSHDTMSVQQFPTDTHVNMNKLPIHSSMRSGVTKNLENDQSENYKVDSLLDTQTALMTPSGIIHGTKSTFQNWGQNSADNTMLRGIIKDGKEPDKSKMKSAHSVLDPVFNKLSLIHNKSCNEHDPRSHSLSNADVTGNRQSLGLLKNSESEIHSAVVSNKGARQLSPINTTYNEVQQLIYLPNSAEIPRETEQEKAKATHPSSCLGPVINKPSPITITHKYSDESLNCSFSHSTFTVDTEFNKLLQKDNPEISDVAPSADSLQSTAVEYLQESPTEITIMRKNGLEHYSRNVTDNYCDEVSCDQYKSKRFGKTNTAFSSPPGITMLWLPSSIICNNQNKPLIHVDRESNQFLQKNKSESHGTDPSPEILTVLQSTTTDIKKCAMHIDPSKVTEIVYDQKSCDKNVEDYQSENHGEILLGRVTDQRTAREKSQQNLPSNNDDTTLDRTLNEYNVQQNKSEIAHVSSAVDTVIGQQFSSNIPHRSKYLSLNYSPNCPAVTLDRGNNKHLQKDNTGSRLPDSLSDQPSINLHNKVKPLTHFPLHNDSNLAAEITKVAENHQSEESSLIPSPDALIDQKSLTNSHCNLNKPLTHSLENSDIEIDENVQKHKSKISPVTSPTYPFTSYRSAMNVKKNTLQHNATKVTDIYLRKRPSGKLKLNVLLKAKSVPSPSAAESTQSIFENISQSSNQDKSKDLRLVRDDISLLVGRENIDKCQTYTSSAVSPTDKLNGQLAPKNISQDWRNILPNCSPNVDGTTVDRDINNTCDAVDKFETTCMLSALNQVSSQLSATDTVRSNEHKPLNHLLNSTAVNVHRESPDYLEKCKHKTKSALLPVDKGIQQKSPTSATDSYKDKPLTHSTVQTDVDVIIRDYNQDKLKLSHVIPPIDLVSSHQSAKNITHSDKRETLNCSLNCATVIADTGVNEYLRKDSPETNPIPAVDLLNDTQSTTTITDIKKNTRHNYSSHLAETCLDKIPYKTFNFKDLHETNSAPSSPPKVTGQWPITNTIHNNQDKSSTRSTLSGEFKMNRRNNSCLQKCKSETNDEFSLSTSLAGQQSPLNIRKSKPDTSLAHSPNRSGFVRDTGVIKNLKNCQPKNNRATFLWPDADIACDINTKFQNWFPTRDLSLNQQCDVNMKHYQSETGNTVSSQDLLIDHKSFIGVTCSKKIKYLRESTKSGYTTLARRYHGSCEQIDKDLINISSPHDLSPTLLSPSDIVRSNKNVTCDHSPICADLPAHDGDNAKGNGKIFRHGRKSFCGEMFQNRTLGMKNANVSNFLQQSSPKKNQIDSDITEINNFRNRLNAYSDISQYRASIDEDDSANNNLQAGTARFSKRYCRFTRSLRPSLQNIPHRCGNMYKAKSLKDINSDYNQSPLQDHEYFFATNSLPNSKLTVRNRQVRPSLQFSNSIKSSRLCRSYSDLPSSDGNESGYNNCISYHDSKFSELLSGNVSKEDKKKETHLENMKRVLVADRLWKPGYLHKESSSPKSEDVFDPCTSEVNQDPGVNDDTGQNDEYFPVDIKIFWPKENPSDIMRLLSSSSTGSKLSENSLSPPQHHAPAVIDKPNFSCYSDTNSDTTTDDEYFLDGNETEKESAL